MDHSEKTVGHGPHHLRHFRAHRDGHHGILVAQVDELLHEIKTVVISAGHTEDQTRRPNLGLTLQKRLGGRICDYLIALTGENPRQGPAHGFVFIGQDDRPLWLICHRKYLHPERGGRVILQGAKGAEMGVNGW